MTVAELKAALAELPPGADELDVWLESECCNCTVKLEDVIVSGQLSHHGDLSDQPDFLALSG